MEELKTYRLADICNSIQTGPFGSQLHKSDYVEFGTPIVMPKDITNGKINDNNISRISKNDVARLFKHKLVPGNIIYPRRGDISKCALITSKEDGWVCGTGCIKVDINQQIANSTYVMYVLCQSETVNWIESNAVGTTMLNLNTSILSDLPIKLPSLNTQKKLANIVSSFDKKIALNRRINDNLEQQAQALFKSWFVDFEPFKNGKFVESEIGMIPEGWKVGNLLDVAELSDSKRKPLSAMERSNMNKVYPYYGATSIMDYVDDYLFDGIYLLMGEDGSVMTENGFPYLQYVSGKFWVNNHAHIMQGKNAFTTEMLHCLLFRKNISEFVTGAVQAKISQNNMKRIKLAIAPANVLDSFSKLLDSIYSQIRQKKKESDVLCKKRDLLLPKLMSGKIKINDLNS